MSVLKTDWLNGDGPKNEVASRPPAIAAIPAIADGTIATIATIAEGQSQISKTEADPKPSKTDLLRRKIQNPDAAIDPNSDAARDGVALLNTYQTGTARTYGAARHVLGWTASRAWRADHWLRTHNLHTVTPIEKETTK